MSNVRLAKLRKQPDSTWALLQKRLISIPEPFEKLFPASVWNLIHIKSNALSTNAGYVSTSLITTTAFLAGTGSILRIGPQEMPLNIYSIFVGLPTTGKSQAIKECAITPTAAVARENDASGCVIQKCTSSGLVKTVAEQEKGFLSVICRNLWHPLQVAEIRWGKRDWRCPGSLSNVFRGRGIVPLHYRTCSRN